MGAVCFFGDGSVKFDFILLMLAYPWRAALRSSVIFSDRAYTGFCSSKMLPRYGLVVVCDILIAPDFVHLYGCFMRSTKIAIGCEYKIRRYRIPT